MKQKVLFVAHMLRGHVLVFHLPYMKWFQEQGYEVHLCSCNDTEKPVTEVPYCDRFFDLPFQRSPFGRQNLQVYREIKKLVDREDYALIHCHTPVGGMVGRLAARGARKRGTRVLYTAHGFHFFTGAPLRNWLLFYPAERFLARFTDLLITINREDEARARRFPARRVARTNGIGVDLSRFEPPADRAAVRAELGIGPDAPMVICVGEHSARKNHETVLRACAGEKDVQVFFSGVGEREDSLRELAAELGMAERTHFLGFRPCRKGFPWPRWRPWRQACPVWYPTCAAMPISSAPWTGECCARPWTRRASHRIFTFCWSTRRCGGRWGSATAA